MKHADGRDYADWEREALEEGGKAGGAYLESIGKSDLATLTKAEWVEFLRTVDAARSKALRDAVPF